MKKMKKSNHRRERSEKMMRIISEEELHLEELNRVIDEFHDFIILRLEQFGHDYKKLDKMLLPDLEDLYEQELRKKVEKIRDGIKLLEV